MSAAQWRRAMNSAATGAAPSTAARPPLSPRQASPSVPGVDPIASPGWLARLGARIRLRHLVVLVAAVAYPFVASPFFTYQIGAQSLALGLIALSLTFLGGYGGMGSVVGASIGALLIGLAEQFGLAYAPTYSVVFTFVIMVVALAFRPRGIMGRAA